MKRIIQDYLQVHVEKNNDIEILDRWGRSVPVELYHFPPRNLSMLFAIASSFRILLRFESPIDGQVYAILNALSVFVGGWINGLAEFSLRVAGAITDRGSIFLALRCRFQGFQRRSFLYKSEVFVVPRLNPGKFLCVRDFCKFRFGGLNALLFGVCFSLVGIPGDAR